MERTVALEPISVPRWAWLLVAVLLFAIYVMALDNGAVLAGSAHTAHELFHDARHFVGVPCH